VANLSPILFVAALLAALYLTMRHPQCRLHAQVSDDPSAHHVDVAVAVQTSTAAEVQVGDQRRRVEADEPVTLHFRFPYSQLHLGENLLPLSVVSQSGRTLANEDVLVLHELELTVEEVQLVDSAPGLRLRYATPPGWRVRIDDRPVASSGLYRLPLTKVVEEAERRGVAVASVDFPLHLQRPDGSAREHIEKIKLDLSARLRGRGARPTKEPTPGAAPTAGPEAPLP